MDKLLYTSLAAMRGAMARQNATAHNLANAQTPGFRADLSQAQALWIRGPALDSRATTTQEIIAADMRAGPVASTGRDLDISLSGDAMLAVQSVDGDEAYTRRGDLMMSETGLLTTGDGRPVLGAQGPIIVPPSQRISLDLEGRISIVPVGANPGDFQEIDRIRLVGTTGSTIAKGLDGLFRVQGGGTLPDNPDARLTTGALEGSNVNATEALVEMIEASRAWDSQLKLIGDARDIDASAADLMRLPG